MAAADEDALLCDFAQYYHVPDWKRLPLRTAAALAQGLPEGSRMIRKLSGVRADTGSVLLARLCDGVALIAWMLSEDGRRGVRRPKSVLELLLGRPENEETELYRSPEDFLAAWDELAGGEVNG